MKPILENILPKEVNNNFKGYKFTEYAFLLITIMTIGRSLIHMLFPDGGAGTIASIDMNVEGSGIIVSMFALWGLSQLLMGIFYVTVSLQLKKY